MYGEWQLFRQNFARVYATYGGKFSGMTLLWSMKFDNLTPNKYDITGALITRLGVCIIKHAPRN